MRRLAAALLAAVLSGCAGRAGDSPPPARLIIAHPQEPRSLNPLILTGANTATLVPLLYSYLLTLDDRGRLQPDVATDVPSAANGGVSRDGLTITYHLRPGVRWQDGRPLTARDVTFTYSAIINPANNVVDRNGYEQIARVDAIGDQTVRVRLHRPYARILSTFLAPNQNYPILPRHLLAAFPNVNEIPFNSAPVGSGPYRVAEWVRGDHLRLVRNDRYFRGTPAIGEIDLKFVSDSNTILNELRTGEVNTALVADPAHLADYAAVKDDRVVRAPLAGIGELFFNTHDPVLSDVRVRRALVEGANFRAIVRNATKGAQTVDGAGRGIFSWGYDPSIPPPRTDTADAAHLLDDAGWTRRGDGTRAKAGHPLAIQFAFATGNAAATSIGVQLQQQLAAIGVPIVLHSYAPAQYRAPAASGGPILAGTFQLAFLEIYTPSDPDTRWHLDCAEAAPTGFNLSRFCDPTVDAAEAAGVATYDPAARRRAAAIVQRRVAEQVPFVALWQQNAVYVVPKTLQGFRPSEQSAVWNVASWSLTAAPEPK